MKTVSIMARNDVSFCEKLNVNVHEHNAQAVLGRKHVDDFFLHLTE